MPRENRVRLNDNNRVALPAMTYNMWKHDNQSGLEAAMVSSADLLGNLMRLLGGSLFLIAVLGFPAYLGYCVRRFFRQRRWAWSIVHLVALMSYVVLIGFLIESLFTRAD